MAADSNMYLGIGAPNVDDSIVYQLKNTAAICLVEDLCAVQHRLL
jgi:hypothetical protein